MNTRHVSRPSAISLALALSTTACVGASQVEPAPPPSTAVAPASEPATEARPREEPAQRLESMQMRDVPPVQVQVDAAAAAKRLAKAVTFPTISNQDRADFDANAYKGFHRFLETSFPRTHRALRREVVGDPRPFTLLYTWQGKEPSLAPVVILAHQDVVPVVPGTEGQWTHGAYSGDVADGYVWGRGSLDDKLPLMAVLEAIEMHLAKGFQPERTFYLVFGHDEEVMGGEGAAVAAKLLAERGVQAALVLDEGAPITEGLFPGVSAPTALIGIAEKGYLTLELKVEAVGGHSSMPPAHSNIGILAQAITKLEAAPFPYRVTPSLRAQFRYLGAELPVEQHALLAAIAFGEERPNPEADAKLIESMQASPSARAGLHTTTAVTMMNAGVKENVLPPSARAVVNFRILQGETVASVTEAVNEIIGDERVQVSRMGRAVDPSPVSAIGGKEYALIEKTLRQTWSLPGLVVAPYLMIGGTDSKYFARSISSNVYRFTPIRVESEEDTKRWHGVNERVLVDEYAKSIGFFYLFMQNSTEL